jgi:hypothetical protein
MGRRDPSVIGRMRSRRASQKARERLRPTRTFRYFAGSLALGHGDDQGDAEPGPLGSSTSDATSGTRAEEQQHAGVPLRRVRAGEVRCEDFLYELKAGLRPATMRQGPGTDLTLAHVQPKQSPTASVKLKVLTC